MSIKHGFKKVLRKIGYDITRFSPQISPLARKKRLIESFAINVTLDVGANTGQFAKKLRNDIGFSGKIVSFEPLSSAFELLKRNASRDPEWEVINCALGDTEEKKKINIAGNSYSSSLLNMLPAHMDFAPESEYIGQELIEIRTLDSIIDNVCSREDNIFLKIDTQGFEGKVIRGGGASLDRIATIQLEMSLIPLYEGELLFNGLYDLLYDKGYSLVSIEPGFLDSKTGQLLQVDGIFHRC